MTDFIELVKQYVVLDSYSSSNTWVGYFERTCGFREDLAHKAIKLFFDAFNLGEEDIVLVSSMHVNEDFNKLKLEYDITDDHINLYIKELIKAGIVNSVDYKDLG
ncbi:hypothetical protein ACFL54_09705, partial [Planctomycetota bacterium]